MTMTMMETFLCSRRQLLVAMGARLGASACLCLHWRGEEAPMQRTWRSHGHKTNVEQLAKLSSNNKSSWIRCEID